MDVKVYLPDDLGERAKAAKLNFSGLLRDAVTEELDRQETVKTTLDGAKEHHLKLENHTGRRFTGRLTGKRIADSDAGAGIEVYLTEDERLLVYEVARREVHECPSLDAADEFLREWLHGDPGEFTRACEAVGLPAIVDL